MKAEEIHETDAPDLTALFEAGDDAGDAGIYEVGYHLTPTLPENEVESVAAAILESLKKIGVEIVGARTPARLSLAYPIDAEAEGRRQHFSSSYFGWVAFAAAPEAVEKVKASIDTERHIFRSLIAKTSRDQVAAILADPALDAGAPGLEPEVEEVVGTDTEGVEKPLTEDEEEKS